MSWVSSEAEPTPAPEPTPEGEEQAPAGSENKWVFITSQVIEAPYKIQPSSYKLLFIATSHYQHTDDT